MLLDGPDCKLWIDVRGSGEPVSVWAHGVTSSSEEVAPFAIRTPGTRVLFDFRGHGRSESPPPHAGYGHEAMERDLRFVADRFRASRAFAVSMGAGALLRWLASDPGRFARLVFFMPGSIDAPNTGIAGFPRLAELLETKPLEEVAEISVSSPEYAPLFAARPHWRTLVRNRIMRMNGVGVPTALRTYAAGDVPLADGAVLRQVTAPALVLGHLGDPLHDADVARRLASLLPNATLRLWPEPLQMLDDVGGFARLVGEFLGAAK